MKRGFYRVEYKKEFDDDWRDYGNYDSEEEAEKIRNKLLEWGQAKQTRIIDVLKIK